MTQQVKRAPGRPKAVAPAPVADAPVSKRPAIRRKEVADENKEYEIPKGHGIVFMLPQKGITVYDKENDTGVIYSVRSTRRKTQRKSFRKSS